MAQYKVIFKGESLDSDKQSTLVKLEKCLKLPSDKAKMLLNGKAYALKKNLPAEAAIEMQSRLLKLGIVTHLVKEVEVTPEISYQEPVNTEETKAESVDEKEPATGQLSVTVDIWYAIKMYCAVHAATSLIIFYTCAYFRDSLTVSPWPLVLLGNILLIPISTKVWKNYSKGYHADITNNEFSFPASDVENSLADIVTLKRFRNLIHRESVQLSDIRALNNEKGRGQRYSHSAKRNVGYDIWKLNISGDFGSRQFEFNSKQKRDECRSMIYTACYRVGNKLRGASDLNLDL